MTVCANCQSPEGPLERTVLYMGTRKSALVLVTCGFRKKARPTDAERNARVLACNLRRAKLNEDGALIA